jgi:hypothetical protein
VHFTDRDLEEQERTGRRTAAEMQQIRAARAQGQAAIADGSFGNIQANNAAAQAEFFAARRQNLVRDRQQAADLPTSVFTNNNMAPHLTPDAVAARLSAGNVTQADRDDIRNTIDNYIWSAPNLAEENSRASIWRNAAQGGANSSWISSLGLTAI